MKVFIICYGNVFIVFEIINDNFKMNATEINGFICVIWCDFKPILSIAVRIQVIINLCIKIRLLKKCFDNS